MTSPEPDVTWTEASEEELERIRLEIGATRRRREQLVADFESFLRETRAAMERRPEAGPPAVLRAAAPPVQPQQHTRLDFGVFDESAPAGGRRPGWSQADVREWLPGLALVLVLLTLAAILYAVFAARGDESVQMPAAAGAPAEQPAVAASSDPGSTAAAATAGSGSPPGESGSRRPVEIQLATVEPVWMRIFVDGERVLEREVPAGQRLRYAADREIVLRAGNAGAVRVAANGGDEQPLGRAGIALTRSFTPPVR